MMVPDLNNMPHVFWDLNKRFFDRELSTPSFHVTHKKNLVGRIICRKNSYSKKPKYVCTISISDYYAYPEIEFESIMLHEMIHYYLYVKGIDTDYSHGKAFLEMAERFNKEGGMNVEVVKSPGIIVKNDKVDYIWIERVLS